MTFSHSAFPRSPRHGTVIPITEEEYQRLLLLPADATGIEKVKGGKGEKAKKSYRKTLHHTHIIITDTNENGRSYDLGGLNVAR